MLSDLLCYRDRGHTMSYIGLLILRLNLILELNLFLLGYYSLWWCKELNWFFHLVTLCALLLISLNYSKYQLFINVCEIYRQTIFLSSSLFNNFPHLWFKLRIRINWLKVWKPTWLIHHPWLVVNLKCSPIALPSLLIPLVHLTLWRVMI